MEQIEIQKYIGNLTSEEFNVFISELNMIPLLTIDEEMKLIHRIRKGGHEGAQACWSNQIYVTFTLLPRSISI